MWQCVYSRTWCNNSCEWSGHNGQMHVKLSSTSHAWNWPCIHYVEASTDFPCKSEAYFRKYLHGIDLVALNGISSYCNRQILSSIYIKVYSVFYKLRFQIFADRSPEIECPEPRLTKLFDPEPVNFLDFCCISLGLNNGTLVTFIKKLLQFCRNYLGLVQFDNSFHVSWLWADANLDNILVTGFIADFNVFEVLNRLSPIIYTDSRNLDLYC